MHLANAHATVPLSAWLGCLAAADVALVPSLDKLLFCERACAYAQEQEHR